MSRSTRHTHLLARVNFPLYTVAVLSERHILVAGGGGEAKTGISNVIEIYELINDGPVCRAELVFHHETGSKAVMNSAIFNAEKYFLLFAGMEGNCQVYKITHVTVDTEQAMQEDSTSDISTLRKRNTSRSVSNSNSSPKLAFKIQSLESFQTDYADEPSQKVVRFSPKSKLLVTGGADGHVRFWQHPKFNQVSDITAHADDVDDLDICPHGKLVVTVSRDGHGKIWNAVDGNLITELSYVLPTVSQSDSYIFRSCRFGLVEDASDVALFCALNPAAREKSSSKSFLCKWDTRNFTLQKVVPVGNDMLSVMAVSDNGHFIAVGTQNGNIKIFVAFSLQCIHSFDSAHAIFVTSMHFLPTTEEARQITGGHEASLVSVSVDNNVVIHHIPNRGSMSVLTLLILFILTLLLTFVVINYLFL